jgi:hypothetical protein
LRDGVVSFGTIIIILKSEWGYKCGAWIFYKK